MGSTRRCLPSLALVLALAACAALAGCGRGHHPRPGTPPRHALLVTVAGLRADHCSAYLYGRETTTFPIDEAMRAAGRALTIDELAHAGVLFAQAFAPIPVATASLGTVHTGRSPIETRMLAPDDALAPDETTLAELFGAAGFETAAFASGLSPRAAGLAQGFDRAESAPDDGAALAAARAFVEGRDFPSGPGLFLWLHLEGPRFPFEPGVHPGLDGAPIDFATRFGAGDHSGPADGSEAYRARVAAGAVPPPDDADREQIVRLYDGELALLDQRLFDFLDAYRALPGNAWRDTVTVLCGTSGVELFREGRWGDADGPHDSSLRVPLFLRHPASMTGRRILGEVVELTDVAPTLTDWFRVDAPPVRGRSLLALTDSHVRRPFASRPAVGLVPARRLYTVRDSESRLVVDEGRLRGETGHVELHPVHLTEERGDERAGLHPERVEELLEELRAWVRSHAAGGGEPE